MSNDEMRREFEQILSLVEEQMQDLTALQQKQKTLTATGVAAEGTVEVTVDAQQRVVKTVIDDSYLDDHEFGELAGFVTEAAQSASHQVGQRSTALFGPMAERRKKIAEMSPDMGGIPEFREVMAQLSAFNNPPAHLQSDTTDAEPSEFPNVRS